MNSFVAATAGHVDHGKSALVRALTGIEPDRLGEEQRRGLTVDLGFAWMRLDGVANVAFVDVPGHERFLGNMLSGLGPAPVVCFVVAADEGWQAQSSDHRDAVAALGIDQGLIVITKADRADEGQIAWVGEQARQELAHTGLAGAPLVVTSARTGHGLAQVRAELGAVLGQMVRPPEHTPVRLWVDRGFSIAGAGTVVTGTLTAGTLARGDQLLLAGRAQSRTVTVRAVQSRGQDQEAAEPVSRVALNLRGVGAEEVSRGDVLLTCAWPSGSVFDVRRVHGPEFDKAGEQVSVHVGSASVPARLRRFDGAHARLTLLRDLPLVVGDRLVLQASQGRRVRAGVVVLDADPPELVRRGAGARRAELLGGMSAGGDPAAEVARRGAVRPERLVELGVLRANTQARRPDPSAAATASAGTTPPAVATPADRAPPPAGVHAVGPWWVAEQQFATWVDELHELVAQQHERDSLAPGIPRAAAADRLGVPDVALVDDLARAAGLTRDDGTISDPQRAGSLGTAAGAVAQLEQRLQRAPFEAPEANDLAELGLGPRELAAANRLGRLLRLPGEVVLLPAAPALAMRELAGLPQPFTASEARRALGTTRRVMIPLLEHLDERGWTRRLADSRREVVR